jgi:transcriptional regulator with XRE-family HTH domain
MAIAELTVDAELVFEALDKQRRRLRMRRREVAEVLGVTPSSYTYWSRGGGINADALLRACSWLDRDARDFARQDEAALTAEGPALTARPSARRNR